MCTPTRSHSGGVSCWTARPVFGGEAKAKAGPAEATVDLKSLHAKIDQLGNDFLEGALTNAGLLSARR
jgi:transposase